MYCKQFECDCPVIQGEDAERFLEDIEKPKTPEQKEQLKKAREVFERLRIGI